MPLRTAPADSRKSERVVITGASSGIGAALARRYAARGALLGLIARRESALRALAGELGSVCEVYAADVRDSARMRACADDFIGRHGIPTAVVGNAGMSIGTVAENPEDLQTFREIIETNVLGLANTFQPFITPMREAGAGVLVGIASVAGYRGLPGSGAYCASKAAVITWLESLRVELRRTGVRVTTICPGYVDTPMTEGNPYAMPFLLSPELAAEKIISVVDRRRSFAVIPWQMAIVARVLRVLPMSLFDRIFENAPRKPRRSIVRSG